MTGVDVCIRDFNSKTIRIREKRRVKVGHIATGISDQVRGTSGYFAWMKPVEELNKPLLQISERVFTLETAQGRQIPHNEEVQESGLELRCVPAPDFSHVWTWRIRDGVLETRQVWRTNHHFVFYRSPFHLLKFIFQGFRAEIKYVLELMFPFVFLLF